MKYFKLTICLLALLTVFTVAKSVSAATIQRAPNNLGLVGYWSFNEGTSTKATDFSGRGNTGAITGANWTGGRLGNALNFDANGENVSIAQNNSIDGSKGTITFWYKPNYAYNDGVGHLIIARYISGVGNDFWIDKWTDGNFNFEITPNDGGERYLSRILASETAKYWTQNQWMYIAVTWDLSAESDKLNTYINCVKPTLTHDDNPTGAWIPPATIYIGNDGEGGNIYPANGLVDEVRIYNRVLTTVEINTFYKSGLSQVNPSAQNKKLNSGLVGLWSFNGADMDWASTTAEALDRSGLGNNGDVINGAKAVSGISGQALKFDGSDDVVSVSDNNALDFATSDFSFSAWLYTPVGAATGATVFGKWNYSDTVGGWSFVERYDVAKYGLQLGKGVAPCQTIWYVGFTTDVTEGVWEHIFANIDRDGYAKLYLNGAYSSQVDISADAACDYSNDYDFQIGSRGTSGYRDEYFKGSVDEVRVYNRLLTPAEISELYNTSAARLKPDKSLVNVMKDNSLVGHWTFNGPDVSNAANLAYDRSGNNNNGTMTNMATTTRYVSGKSGQALNFDGVNDYATAGTTGVDTAAGHYNTVSFWMYWDGTDVGNTGRMPFSWGGQYYDLYLVGGSCFGFNTYVPAVYGFYDSGMANTWVYITAVFYNGDPSSDSKLYKNGVEQSLSYCWGESSTSRSAGGTINLATGSDPDYYFGGKLDEVRIYNRALSASDVLQLYRASGGR